MERLGICICAGFEVLHGEDATGSDDASLNHVGLSFPKNFVPRELFVVVVRQIEVADGSCNIVESMSCPSPSI